MNNYLTLYLKINYHQLLSLDEMLNKIKHSN